MSTTLVCSYRLMSSNKVLTLLKNCLGHESEQTIHKEKKQLVVYIPSSRGMNTNISSNGSRPYHDRTPQRAEVASTNHVKPTDPQMDLPPFIPYSDDGEEGYANSQKQLPVKQFFHQSYECFRPPNRTVSGRESPPTYRANSYSLIDKENGKGPTRIVKNNRGEVTHCVRCYTMGNNNEYSLSRSAAVESTWFSRTVGRSRNCSDINRNSSISEDPPPYSEAVAESNPTVFTRGSTGSI